MMNLKTLALALCICTISTTRADNKPISVEYEVKPLYGFSKDNPPGV